MIALCQASIQALQTPYVRLTFGHKLAGWIVGDTKADCGYLSWL